ncbi:hypothetical protein BDZ91DRAFT_801054 [Kalaharituber pfeilii]|nr:hypothetical protein BDZ91DRAFT_801054 [Kalaharituber pfeilii]
MNIITTLRLLSTTLPMLIVSLTTSNDTFSTFHGDSDIQSPPTSVVPSVLTPPSTDIACIGYSTMTHTLTASDGQASRQTTSSKLILEPTWTSSLFYNELAGPTAPISPEPEETFEEVSEEEILQLVESIELEPESQPQFDLDLEPALTSSAVPTPESEFKHIISISHPISFSTFISSTDHDRFTAVPTLTSMPQSTMTVHHPRTTYARQRLRIEKPPCPRYYCKHLWRNMQVLRKLKKELRTASRRFEATKAEMVRYGGNEDEGGNACKLEEVRLLHKSKKLLVVGWGRVEVEMKWVCVGAGDDE